MSTRATKSTYRPGFRKVAPGPEPIPSPNSAASPFPQSGPCPADAHLSPEEYRKLYDLAPLGCFIIRSDTTIVDVNTRGALMLATTRDALIGAFFTDFIHATSEEILDVCKTDILGSEDWRDCELDMVRADGTSFSASLLGRHLEPADELAIFVIDITALRRSEQALRESEQKYKEVADRLAEGVFETDAGGRVSYANQKVMSSLGLTADDLLSGIHVFDVIVPEDLPLARERLARVLNREDVGASEYCLRRRDGSTFPALVHSLAIVRDGRVAGVRGILIDITDRKRVETALQESERRYRELSELLDAGVFETDLTGTLTYTNPKGLAMFGLTEEDFRSGLPVFNLVLPDDLSAANGNFARVLNGEDIGPIEYTGRRKDGTLFPILTYSSAIVRDGVSTGIRGIAVDISELKKAEQALRDSEQRYSTLLKSLNEGIWVLDKDDVTTYVNPRMAEMLGYTEEEMLGKPVYAFTDDEWRKYTAEMMERRKHGVTEQIEGGMVRKDGGRVHALLAASPILDEAGRYIGSIAGVQDITERKIAEEKLIQTLAELDRSNKELEQFAYVTSHDLREPLRMMTSFSQLLEKHYKGRLDSDADEYIHFIVNGATRMQRLIDDILIYSRVGTRGQAFQPVNLEDTLKEALLDLKGATEETGASITHGPLPTVQADPTQMKQVLQNLVGNAVKFHRDEETPAVHISATREGREWVVSVRDNGIGMDPELFDRLFILFQRLHPPDRYPGTGVGLAVTKKIVQRHGGRIWVESKPGRGSIFRFSLPADRKGGEDGRS